MATSIRNQVIFGLKVSFNFSDVESRITALQNIGLDIRDLNVIRGVSDSLSKVDLQNVSGLDVNLTRYLDRLKSDTSLYAGIVNRLSGYQFTTQGNLEAYGPIAGSAVRYKYIPNDQGTSLTQANLKFGDISTSRVSSWSSATSDETDLQQPISYGASVQVKGALKINQSGAFPGPGVGEALINVLDVPEPIRFSTEVATDIIQIELDGQPAYLYAMRGIPVVFTTAFKSLSMNFKFQTVGVNPIFTIQATDGSESEIQSTPSVSSSISQLRYNAPTFKERTVKLYYPPNNILQITGTSLSIRNFPAVKFKNLDFVELSRNLLGEMPDWQEITYDENNDSKLTYISLQNNPLYQNDTEEYTNFGTKVVERLPKTLTTLYLSGTYFGNTTFLTPDESLVIKNITQSEYNLVTVNPESNQTFTFDIQGTPVDIAGKYYDKHAFDGIYYVYIRDPDPSTQLNQISGYTENVDILDLSTRCPNLQTFYMRNSSGRYIYKNSNSKSPDVENKNLYTYQTAYEISPRVNLKNIRTYDIYDNYYTRLSDVFLNPGNYLDTNDVSQLRTFQVGENEALTSNVPLDFSKMTSISSISISDTALPIPSGLQTKTSLGSISCSYTRFPSRSGSGVVDSVTGDGNPSGANNFFFSSKNPSSFGQYVFSDCSGLSSLSFYASGMDGMIPKFTGNSNLRSIDLRYTSIEGGRPANLTANGGLHGRSYIMWDDTFQDCQQITDIRIRSSVLGRNIGTYNSGTGTYSSASFQGSTFNLPLLTYLEIVSSGGYITGNFFNVGLAPNLQYLVSPGSGWGTGTGGTPLPTFAGNPNIYYIDLTSNNFTGNISLSNLNKLRYVYLSSNDISGFSTFSGLSALNYFILGNNPNLSGALPNFSSGSPNIQYISLNNCNLNGFSSGRLSGATRLRSLDLSNNNFNQSSIDAILDDLVVNYTNSPRSGVIINLTGNVAPSTVITFTPTQTTATAATENITVDHPDPIQNFGPSPERTLTLSDSISSGLVGQYLKQNNTGAYGKISAVIGADVVIDNTDTNANGTLFNSTDTLHVVSNSSSGTNAINKLVNLSLQDILLTSTDPGIEQIVVSTTNQDPLYEFTFSINLRDGYDPPGGNIEYVTTIKLNGTDITNLVTVDYAANKVTFPGNSPGNVTNYPPDGSIVRAEVISTTYGQQQNISGGVVTAQTLRNFGWIVRTN